MVRLTVRDVIDRRLHMVLPYLLVHGWSQVVWEVPRAQVVTKVMLPMTPLKTTHET